MNGLAYIRKLYNMTLDDLANELGVSNQFISMWEKGKKPIPKKYFNKLYELFNVGEEYYGDIEPMQTLIILSHKLRKEMSIIEDDDAVEYSEYPPMLYKEDDRILEYINDQNELEIQRQKMIKKVSEVIINSYDESDALILKHELIINFLSRFLNLVDSDVIPIVLINSVLQAFELTYLDYDDWGDCNINVDAESFSGFTKIIEEFNYNNERIKNNDQ